MSPQTQTADGTGRVRGPGPLNRDFVVFAAGADVYKQRTDRYADEYAEVQVKSTQRAMCLPAGGELHMSDGQVVPVAPYDWVVEQPDGTMGSLGAEQVADHLEIVGGSDAMRELFDLTVQHVENARKAPTENVATLVDDVGPMPNPDEAEGLAHARARQDSEYVLNEFQRQTEQAHARLELLAGVAVKRQIITKAEAAEWVDTSVTPEGVVVHFDQALMTFDVVREPAATTPSPGGATAVAEPPVEPEQAEPSEK